MNSTMHIRPNTIFQADGMSLLKRLENNVAKLVYLDPPFSPPASDFMLEKRDRKGLDNRLVDDYLDWLSQVMDQACRVVDLTGNVIIHTEPRTTGYIRLIAENLYKDMSCTEIILPRPRRYTSAQRPRDEHETLLVCRKSNESTWNPVKRPLEPEEIVARFPFTDSHGKFIVRDLTGPGNQRGRRYPWNGFILTKGQSWRFSQEEMDRLNAEGRIQFNADNRLPRLKVYADEHVSTPIGTIWDDIPQNVRPGSKEQVGYSTQQPLPLMDRIIRVSTNQGDLVVDPFFGSGTLLVAAQSLGRSWIGSDIDPVAQDVTKRRLASLDVTCPEHYSFGDEKDLSSYDVIHDSRSISLLEIIYDRNTRFVLGEKMRIEETRHYEFKALTSLNPARTIADSADEYAVAFLNREGGRIYWGVQNKDRVIVGVQLDYSQRDEVSRTTNVKLSQIQPTVAPSSWRLVFHRVYNGSQLAEDLFVVELVVPPSPDPKILYATGSGEVFVKTDSGKKKLSFMEIQAEITKRVTGS